MPSFLEDLEAMTRPAERGHHAFVDQDGQYLGFVQLLFERGRKITLHRIWTIKPGVGHGGLILRKLCDLADRHAVVIELKALPIGRKPYPLSREQLMAWYGKFGFKTQGRKMIRMPSEPAPGGQ